MAERDEDRSYDEARKLTENAMDAYAKGNPKQGDRLAEQAKRTNTDAVRDVVDELEEDKDADHESFTASGKDPAAEK
jgi:hypothetical protein